LPTGELVSGSRDGVVKIWDLQTGSCIKTLGGHTAYVYYLQVLSASEFVRTSYDATIKIWDLQTNTCIKIFQGHHSAVCCLQVLPTGKLISGSNDNTINLPLHGKSYRYDFKPKSN
jgi:WD40 repeat protein